MLFLGINKEGGVGRICQIHSDGTYSIRFHVGKQRVEKNVPAKYISEYDMFSQQAAVSDHFVLCESHGEGSESGSASARSVPEVAVAKTRPRDTVSFVRRSIRRPGEYMSLACSPK